MPDPFPNSRKGDRPGQTNQGHNGTSHLGCQGVWLRDIAFYKSTSFSLSLSLSPSPWLQGVLLYGPPGTGKTLLARAVAHHTECCFIRVSGSELVQKYIGEGSRMVRELFVMAREHAPSIIFMDEIDSIGSSRLGGGSGGELSW